MNPLPGLRILGLHIPEMKKIAKELAGRADCSCLLDRLESAGTGGKSPAGGLDAGWGMAESAMSGCVGAPDMYYEEYMIWGLMLDFMKVPLEERLERFGRFIPAIDNWAVCDCVCGAAKWAAGKGGRQSSGISSSRCQDRERVRAVVWDFLDRWWQSGREFEVRFAIIMAMSYFLDGTWLPEVFRKIGSLDYSRIESEYVFAGDRRSELRKTGGAGKAVSFSGIIPAGLGYRLDDPMSGTVLGRPPYYVKMGVAWLMATALAKFPEQTRAFARGCDLPEDVLKLYVRKARESFRTRGMETF